MVCPTDGHLVTYVVSQTVNLKDPRGHTMLVKTEGSSGRSSPCRSRQSDAEKATRAVQLMWEKNWPRQCHVAHDDGLAGVFVSATKNVVGPPG